MKTYYYNVAELALRIDFMESDINDVRLVPSLQPFEVSREEYEAGDRFFRLTVDDSLKVRKDRQRIRAFDTGNGDTVVDVLPDGGYQYIIKDIRGASCCLLQTDKEFANCRCALNGDYTMRHFGLNNALMLIFAFAGARRGLLLMHASTVRCDGRGFAFIAKSGTGKSTQVSMWLRHIPGCDLMNDDNPIIRIKPDGIFIYGSPWSGKTPCYRRVKAPLGGITRIDRAQSNSMERQTGIQAFASVLPSCSSMKWDHDIYNAICDSVTTLVERIPIHTLHCLPDREAAETAHSTLCSM